MSKNRYIIDTVWTATRVIEIVAMSKAPLGAAEIAKALDIKGNNAFRQCATLTQAGVLEDCGDKKFKLGMKMALFWARKKSHLEGERDAVNRKLEELEA